MIVSTRNAFEQAHSEYRAPREIEQAIVSNDAAGEAALHEATDSTDAVFDLMMAMPVTDPRHAGQKLAAIFDQYDVGACGVDRAVGDQVLAEVLAYLAQRHSGDDPHRSMLDRRDSLIEHANTAALEGDAAHDVAVTAFVDAEDEIVALPAATVEGAFVKMLVLMQQIGMGHEVTDRTAWPVAEEAAALIGSRTLASLGYSDPRTATVEGGVA